MITLYYCGCLFSAAYKGQESILFPCGERQTRRTQQIKGYAEYLFSGVANSLKANTGHLVT